MVDNFFLLLVGDKRIFLANFFVIETNAGECKFGASAVLMYLRVYSNFRCTIFFLKTVKF